MAQRPYKVVLDTSVIVAGVRSRFGASFELLSSIPSDRFELQLSVALAVEYESVMSRLIDRAGFTADDAATVLNLLCLVAEKHDIHYLWRPFLRDPSDEFILELAIKSSSDLIVTHNLRDFAGAESFGIRAITPGGFVKLLDGEP